MDGKMIVTYKVVCKNDFNLELTLDNLLTNEKISRLIKSEFAKAVKNLDLFTKDTNSKIYLETKKDLYQIEVNKDDFADLLTLAEEDATSRKLIKKEHSHIELVNIETID